MARKISDKERYVSIHENEYYRLIKDSLTLNALLKSGLRDLDLYKGIASIIDDGHVEIHIKEIKKKYR